MVKPPSAQDDLAAFVRRTRAFASESEAQLRELVDRCAGASPPGASHAHARAASGAASASATPPDELRVRDEELAAACEEMRAQLDALTRALALLERERAKYVDLFMNAPDAYVVTNLQGTTQEANLAAGALFGAEPASLVHRPLIAFVARQDTRPFRTLLRELGDEAAPPGVRDAAFRMRPRGQPVFVALVRAMVVRSAYGEPIAIRWQLRRRETTLLDAAGRLADAELARALVAELQPPLDIVAGWTRLLRAGEIAAPPERDEALGRVHDGATRIQSLVRELSELAEAHEDGDGVDPAAEIVDVGARLRAVLAARLPAAASAAPRGEALVRAAPVRVDRLFELLCADAVDGRGDADAMAVRVSSTDGEVLVTFASQARGPRATRVRLATAARLAATCGGRLTVGADGATVELRLPRVQR